MKVVKPWSRLSGEIVDAPFLESRSGWMRFISEADGLGDL